MADHLRKKAEELLKQNPLETPVLSTVQVQKLLHELDVHQIELQMQNEELRQAQIELAATRDTYVELYDFAPVGYLALDPEGRIVEANFTAATMLGLERGKLLVGRTFASFVRHDALEAWDAHRQDLMDHREKQGADLILQRPDGSVITVRVECSPRLNAQQEVERCLMALVDITQRVQAEEALHTSERELAKLNVGLEQLVEERSAELRESEERFRLLFEEAPDACFLIGLDGRFIDGNKAVELQTGYSRDELIGQSVFESEIFPISARKTAAARIAQLERGGELDPVEYSLARKDGTELFVEVSTIPILLQGKTVFLSNARDLTPRKQAEAERAFLARQRQLALDAAGLGWWLYNPETERVTFDQRFGEIYGASGDECPVEDLLQLLHPADLSLVLAAIEAAMNPHNPQPYVIEYRVSRPDGSLRWIEAHGLAEFEGRGDARRATGLSGTVADISERRKSETALRESEERFRAIFEEAADGIVMADPETKKFHSVNRAVCSMLGYSEEELQHMAVDDIHPAEGLPRVRDVFEKQERGELPLARDMPLKRCDGSIIYADIKSFPLLLNGKRYLVGIFRDITERMAREEELGRNRDELRKLASELSLAEQRERRRVAIELHDGVSQLLSSSCLRLEVLKESPLPEGAVETLDTVCGILHDTLEQTRSLTFELSCPMLSELGLAAALEELCASMTNEYSIRFEFKGDTEPLPLDMDLQIVLYRATRELLINVMKHSNAEWAGVELVREKDGVRIGVEDHGIGFDASMAGEGFSPSGGFGLFNIREYLRHAGGTLKIESIPGDGTEVVLTVPLEVAHG
jgi:PAS domain S-box-containing protein